MKKIERYELNQSRLYKCHSKRKLSELLNVDLKTIIKISHNPKYSTFTKSKKNTTELRTINAPTYKLKQLQKSMYGYLKKVKRPDWLMSGEMGKNWTDNAKKHKNSSNVVKADISKFFDNCKREYVYKFLLNKLEQSPDVADICTSLVMVDGKIVQGASTSMVIAFYSYQSMFEELFQLANDNNCIFTVYVDDLTYSSNIPIDTASLKKRISQIINAYDQKFKSSKFRSYGKYSNKKITGVINNSKKCMVTPNGLQAEISRMFKEYLKLRKKGLKNTIEAIKLRNSLIGKITSARQIERGKFSNMYRTLLIDSK